jgi:hypothetical protein
MMLPLKSINGLAVVRSLAEPGSAACLSGIDPGIHLRPETAGRELFDVAAGRRRRPAMMANAAKQWEVELISRE